MKLPKQPTRQRLLLQQKPKSFPKRRPFRINVLQLPKLLKKSNQPFPNG